jgi:hypothetical protein
VSVGSPVNDGFAASGIVFHPSWPPLAQALLRRAIDRHGGWSLWARLEAVTVNLGSLHGFLPWWKGSGRSFRLARSLTTFPKAVRTEWSDGPAGPLVAVFDRGDMRLLDATGSVVADSRDHRLSFRGWRKLRRWDALDAHYFFGYAFASYTTAPFILPGLPYTGMASGRARGRRLRGVWVELPAGAQVHSRRQAYLFDEDGLLRRNDYVADVVGRWAVAAHLCDDYTTVEGLALPARRTVYRRLGGGYVPFPVVLSATFTSFGVRLGGAQKGMDPVSQRP